MRKRWGFYFVAALMLASSQLAQAQPTTVTSGSDVTSGDAHEQARIGKELRSIRAYCAGIDRFIQKHQGRREFVRVVDKSIYKWIEVTGDQSAYPKALIGATTYSQNGKCIYVECFTKSQRSNLSNTIRYYFRPDGTLAKSKMIVRSFQTPHLDNNVVVLVEQFQDGKGVIVDYSEEYRNPKTDKKIGLVIYSAQMESGSCGISVHYLGDLCFSKLLEKAR